MDKYPTGWARYSRALTKYREDKRKHRTTATVVTVFWGPTGTGKSHAAHHMAADVDEDYGVLMCPEKGRAIWVDGAEGCKAVVIDDYEGELPYRAILQMTDKYKCVMPVKGGRTKWAPTHIFITSNLKPEDWYPHSDYGPLQRRLTSNGSAIIHKTEVYVENIGQRLLLLDEPSPMAWAYGDGNPAGPYDAEPWEVPAVGETVPGIPDEQDGYISLD